jgi:oligopeptidase B
MRPDLYAGIVAEVPFVDVIGTMTDATIPLTTLEYGEWGNPAIPDQYRAMLAYSPYDNVAPNNYPSMFLTAGWFDSQVGFHEPAKWVARLRASKTDSNDILLKTNMGAGHNGDSGRFGSVQERAEVIAWLLAEAARRR